MCPKLSTSTSWDQTKQALILQYGDKFIEDNSRRQLEELTQTGRVQDYLAKVECLNGHAGLSQKDVLSLIYRKIKPKLREIMAPFHSIRAKDLLAWMNTLVSCGDAMDQNSCLNRPISNNKNRSSNGNPNNNHHKDKSNGGYKGSYEAKKSNGKKPYELKPQPDLKDTPPKSKKEQKGAKKSNYVTEEMKEKRKQSGQYEKCGRENHSTEECSYSWRAQMPPKPFKKRKEHSDVRITELGSDAGKD